MAFASHPIPPVSRGAGSAPDSTVRLSPAQAGRLIGQRLETALADQPLGPVDIQRLALRHTYRTGQVILPRGARADCLGLVVAGRVGVYGRMPSLSLPRQAGQRPDAILRPGDTFGEAMLARRQPNDALLQALTPCEVWFVRRADLAAATQDLAPRQASRRAATIRRLALPLAIGLALVLCLVVLALPAARQALAVGPMAIGQWCQQGGHASCAHAAWTLAASLTPADANPRPGSGQPLLPAGRYRQRRADLPGGAGHGA